MSNKEIKSGGLMVAMFIYLVVFGIKVDVLSGDLNPSTSQCKPIPSPIVQAAPSLPAIDKTYLDDKSYVIRVLVNHINTLNKHIADSTKQTAEIYNTYTKCVAQ